MLILDWVKAGFAVLVLLLATAMLYTKALTGDQWVAIASADLWAYLLAHVASIAASGVVSYMVDAGEAKRTRALDGAA